MPRASACALKIRTDSAVSVAWCFTSHARNAAAVANSAGRGIAGARGHQLLDGVGEVFLGNVMRPGREPERVRAHQDVGRAKALGRLELVAREFDPQPVRIAEVDRVHEAAVERLE